jgi:hypothetical protein
MTDSDLITKQLQIITDRVHKGVVKRLGFLPLMYYYWKILMSRRGK